MDDSINLLKNFSSPKVGTLLSFEGTEGCGKSTQILVVKDWFIKHGYEVKVLREPGGTPLGEKVRSLLLQRKEIYHPLTEVLLFLVSRAQLIENEILPFLNQPKRVVLLDRYIDSTLVYQGLAQNIGLENILNIHKIPPLNLIPQQTFYLKVNYETSCMRQSSRANEPDHFEKKNKDFFEKVILGYDYLAKSYPDRIKIINANQSINQTSQSLINILEETWAKNDD